MQKTQDEIIKITGQIRNNNNLDRVWVHFDMDMFYVACELLDKPDLIDKPCAVGGMDMLSTANYVARQYGVRSAMPGFIAKELCP
jgi:DNA polymerase kappa